MKSTWLDWALGGVAAAFMALSAAEAMRFSVPTAAITPLLAAGAVAGLVIGALRSRRAGGR